jgi:hypothetical protein
MALQKAYENIHRENFTDSFDIHSDSSYAITIKVTIGNFFDDKKYLIVRRETPVYYVDIYLKSEDKFVKVLSHEQWGMTYVNDTIQDINGDGRKDFLLNWYGASGCCLKNFIDVYLLRNDGTFSEQLEFINPTFSVAEKVIRGVCYGHPGQTELYKYKWNGFIVDTVEYIYPSRDMQGQYIKTKYRPFDKRNKEMILRSVPAEYKTIEGFDWFMGFESGAN